MYYIISRYSTYLCHTSTSETIILSTIASSIHVQRKYIINATPYKQEVINKYNELFNEKMEKNND